jgi:hypothetical protein
MSTSTQRYSLDGTLLEACSCAAPCPCWVGHDPDGGRCEAINAYHLDQGNVDGVDVSGLSLVQVAEIPGNVLNGHWRQVLFVDDRATPAQRDALVAAFSGKLGGPLADLAALAEEPVAVYSVPIDYSVQRGKSSLRVVARAAAAVAGSAVDPASTAVGTLRAGTKVAATVEAFRDAQGRVTTLENSPFTVIPGSPAFLGNAPMYQVDVPEHQMVWTFSGRNGIQGSFHFET